MSPDKKLPSEKKVMVLDDDDSILQMVRATLEAEGFQVKTARDCHNVLKKAVEYRPDLIICDLMMPGGGGYELIRILQSDDLTRKTPILMMTGYAMDESTKALIQSEPNLVGYFEKPVRGEKLVKKAHEILNTKSMAEQIKERQNQSTGFDDTYGRGFH